MLSTEPFLAVGDAVLASFGVAIATFGTTALLDVGFAERTVALLVRNHHSIFPTNLAGGRQSVRDMLAASNSAKRSWAIWAIILARFAFSFF